MRVPLWLALLVGWTVLAWGLCALFHAASALQRLMDDRLHDDDHPARPDPLDTLRAADRALLAAGPEQRLSPEMLLRLHRPRLAAPGCQFCGSDHQTAECPHRLQRTA